MARRTATGPNGEKVELVDGQWVPLRPEPQSVLESQVEQYAPPNPDTWPHLKSATRSMAGEVLANIWSVPHAAGELLSIGAATPALIPGGRSFTEERARQEQQYPAKALLALPDPSAEDVLAIPSTISKSMQDAFLQRRRLLPQRFNEAVTEEQNRDPFASNVGRTVADVGMMMAMRPGQRAADALKLGPFNPRAEISTVKGALDRAARTLARGTGRTVEAGFDGAVIGALSDGDPVKTAAWSAGVQAGGSMAMAAKNSIFKDPMRAFFALYLGHEMFKAIAPGPQDLFESKDTAVDEMVAAYGLGTLAALAGSTRNGGAANMQRIADAMSTASRATIASVVTQLQEAAAAKQPQYARVIELLSQDQERFGTEARVLIERASRSDKPRALLDQIDQLMRSARFKRAYDNANEQAQPPNQASQLGSQVNTLGQQAPGRPSP